MKDRGQVLIAGYVYGESAPNLSQGAISSGLRPTIRIHIGENTIADFAVDVRAAAKDGL